MTGTANQVEWAERIKRQVNDEFDRVARSFRAVAAKQSDPARADTNAIVAILEEKRAAVMLREQAGYFIHDWQETGGQVRQMIFDDARYQAIQSKRLQTKGEAKGIVNIRPLNDRIVVKRVEEQESIPHGIVIPDSAKEKPQEGKVQSGAKAANKTA